VNRSLFDKHVARIAEAAGAQYIMGSRVESLIIEDNFTRGILLEKIRENERKFADIVIDAEGVSSRLLRQFGLSSLDRRMVVNGVEAEVEGVKDTVSDEVEVFLGKEYAPGFYAWLIPKNDGSAKVGLASRSGNSLEFLLRLIKKHPVASEQLRHARVMKKAFHPITLGGSIPRAFGNGFLAVGDVASQVKPTTGGGMILGMNCARIAAEVANEAFDRNDFSAKYLGEYERRCDEFSGFDMRVMLRIRKMLNRLSDERLDDLIGFCSRFRIDEAFRNVDDLVLQARGFLRAAHSPQMFAVLAYFFFVYLSANP
jgi:digeranylgeranylglycerophospholipid reductase